MGLKRRHPEPLGCVLRATLFSKGTASISLPVQRKIPFPSQYFPRFNISSGSGKTSILMALLGT